MDDSLACQINQLGLPPCLLEDAMKMVQELQALSKVSTRTSHQSTIKTMTPMTMTVQVPSMDSLAFHIQQLGLPPCLLQDAMKMVQDLSTKAGEFLHNLHVKTNCEDEVRAVINAFPESLSHINSKGQLPINSAVRNSRSTPFVPLLAEQGVKLKVGGEGKRGGLLVDDPSPLNGQVYNVLQLLVNMQGNIACDSVNLDVLIKLRESKLLCKEDIQQYDLSYWSCSPTSNKRFEYLVDWDPEALKDCNNTGYPLIHAAAGSGIELFVMAVKAGMKHFPEELGFLFRKNGDGKTACEVAIDKHGKDETMKIIQDHVPETNNHPILHHVIQNAPQYMNDFVTRYPSAVFLRDEKHRTLHHVALSSGASLRSEPLFLSTMSDEKVEEKDPVTDLYPFTIAASAKTPDLWTVYYLLRRNPAVMDRSRRLKNRAPTKASKKRKRR